MRVQKHRPERVGKSDFQKVKTAHLRAFVPEDLQSAERQDVLRAASEVAEEEWYSVEEVCAKFNMSKEAVYRFVSERKIGKRKDKCKVFYSRRQFDKAMGVDSELEPEYYTMPEAMARYNMTRDQISHYVRTHNIPRTYEGRYVRIDRKALDALFAPPKIG